MKLFKWIKNLNLFVENKVGVIKYQNRYFHMEVVGESYYQNSFRKICGPHTRYGYDETYVATIKLDPRNRHDKNAVEVRIKGLKVGHLSRSQAKRVSSQMRQEGLSMARCDARVTGGWRTNQYDEGYFGVKLGMPEAGWIDFGIGTTPPKETAIKTSKKTKIIRPQPAEDGPLLGHWVAIIGDRSDGELAYTLASKGAKIMAGVGKSTTLLVVACEERPFSPGLIGSATFRKAQERISEGSILEIVTVEEALQINTRPHVF